MNLFSSLGIAKRLFAASVFISLALIGVLVYASLSLTEVENIANRTESNRVPQLQRMAAIELNITRVSLQLRHAILARTPQELATTLDDVGEKRKLLDKALTEYQTSLFTPAGKDLFAKSKVPELMARFWELGGENIKLITDGKKDEAFAFLVDKTIPVRNQLLMAVKENLNFQENRLSRDIGSIDDQAIGTIKILVVLVVVVVVTLQVLTGSVALPAIGRF